MIRTPESTRRWVEDNSLHEQPGNSDHVKMDRYGSDLLGGGCEQPLPKGKYLSIDYTE